MIYPNNVKVFFLEPTDRERMWLRRFSYPRTCPKKTYGCDARVPFGEADVRYGRDADGRRFMESRNDRKPSNDDPLWPKTCEVCGTPFEEKDEHQLLTRQIYVRIDTGEKMTLEEAPPGACWDAWWMTDRRDGKRGSGYHVGPDGRCLTVRCPDGHDWMVDSRCSNCTRPEDNDHFCWVRHGKPEDGTLHVDKNGDTCSAGAGSIQTSNWHGFLHNGVLHS